MPVHAKTGICTGKCIPLSKAGYGQRGGGCAPSVGTNLKRPVPIPSDIRDQYQARRSSPLSMDYARWAAWHQGIANAPEPPSAPRREEQAATQADFRNEVVV